MEDGRTEGTSGGRCGVKDRRSEGRSGGRSEWSRE